MKTIIEGIVPFDDKKLTCFERPLYAYINALGMNPEYLGLATWSFTGNYVKDFQGIANNTPMQWIVDGVDCIYGVQMHISQPENHSAAITIIERELVAGRPVMVYIDSFFCPWYPSYYRSHINHYVLVVGISHHDELICLDRPNQESPYRLLPYRDYYNGRGLGEIIQFRFPDTYRDVQYHAKCFFHRQLARMRTSNQFEKIRQFASYIRESFSINDELDKVHDYRVASIYTWLKGISTSREKFAVALKMCDIDMQEDCVDELKHLSIQWMNILVQLMLAKDRAIDLDHLADLILTIADQEEACFNKLFSYFVRLQDETVGA